MIKFFLGVIVSMAAVVILAISFLGVVPVLSDLVGASPKDLGQNKTTIESSDLAQAKFGIKIVLLPKDTPLEKGYVLEGKMPIDIEMDSQELTSLANNRSWASYPIKSIQIRINQDGSVESSGILVVSKAMPYAVSLGYSESQIREAMQKYNLPSIDIPFYLHGTGSVENNKIDMKVNTFKIGAIAIPQSIVFQAEREATLVLENLLSRNSQSVSYEYVRFEAGKVKIKGTVAEREYVIPK